MNVRKSVFVNPELPNASCLVFHIRVPLLQLFLSICEDSTLHPSLPPLPLSSLTFSSPFPGESYHFFSSSLFFQGYAQWPSSFCLRRPDTSPLSVFSSFPFRTLFLSQHSSSICLHVTFSIPLFPPSHPERQKRKPS